MYNKIFVFFSLLFITLFLSSCFWDSKEVIKAKQDLGIIENTPSFNLLDNKKEDLVDLSEDPRISIKQISGDKILELDELKYNNFKDGHSKITWKTLGFVSKIKVDFSNDNSEYPNDQYILTQFKSWWKNFIYNANSKYKVLDFWLNTYIFTAFTENGESVLELKVLVSKNDDKYLEWWNNNIVKKEESTTNKLIWTEQNIVFANLPEGSDFGNVIKLWEKSFTYSDIKWLEIKKDLFLLDWKSNKITCKKNEETDNYFITDFLKTRQDSWYYWNTCRDIIKDKWISFYVLRLSWDNYFYEKHYLDFVHWFYWVYEIKKGEGIDKYTIAEKNKKLKELNHTFIQVEIVDNLFKKIIQ